MATTGIEYLQDPALEAERKVAETQQTQAAAYQSAASLLPFKLKEAVMGKLDYNKDIIEAQNKAMSEYFMAPSKAREKYQNIWDPFARERLVTEERTQAYAPYATLTDILGQRMGSISDIIQAGTGAFTAATGAQESAATLARQKYQDLWERAKTIADYLKPAAGEGGGITGLDYDPMTGQWTLNGKPISGQQPMPTPTEPEPMYTPLKGEGTPSLKGQWIYHNGEWMINTEAL